MASASSSTTTGTPAISAAPQSRARLYRTRGAEIGEGTKWVTRDIAALDFLLNIPMAQEASIVQAGWQQQRGVVEEVEQGKPPLHSIHNLGATGRWWEKFVAHRDSAVGGGLLRSDSLHGEELERPEGKAPHAVLQATTHMAVPGRRLDGDDAIKVTIPVTGIESRTRQRSIARQAAIREFEIRVAHGLDSGTPMLNGRVFFSARGSYPMGVFSVVRYEPKKEEAARRRQKLEELGMGGTQFVFPERDWRGTSYRALLQRRSTKRNKTFNRLIKKHEKERQGTEHSSATEDTDDDASTSSEEGDAYVPGFLDDPEMVQGRHRHVMIGDRVTGPLVSSTIQFVKPADLKAELNKQFRDRFDGWEPPKSQWKFIGAKVIDGVYTLLDPTEAKDQDDSSKEERRTRQGSVSSMSSTGADLIRMPPSLTLSKIRNLKQQALMAAVSASLEVGTVALACVYFERLCLDCRVDKTNRRLTFAACLLLSAKINESNVKLVMQRDEVDESSDMKTRISTFIRPTKKSDTIFASLLEFFTHDWKISLKQLFAAEWGVFASLKFEIHAKPSQVEFHFLRLMKMLELNPMNYLGHTMYAQWQESLLQEEIHRKQRHERREKRQERKQRKVLELERELRLKEEAQENLREVRAEADWGETDEKSEAPTSSAVGSPGTPEKKAPKKGGFFNLLSMKRPTSTEKLDEEATRLNVTMHMHEPHRSRLRPVFRSPSLPAVSNLTGGEEDEAQHVSIEIREADDDSSEPSSAASFEGGIIV